MNASPQSRYLAPTGMDRVFNSTVAMLTRAGISVMGSRVLAVRGRKSGEWRTTPVNLLTVDGTRYLVAPRGQAQWVRNLRAAGHATITFRRREEEVRAFELSPDQRVAFFRDTLTPIARRIRGGMWFIRAFDGVDLSDPVAAAKDRPVFELRSTP